MLDEHDQILLLCGATTPTKRVWFMPGGGLEPGEGHEDAARRELWEETSLRVDAIGPCVWTRNHAWRAADGTWIRSLERFFLVRVPHFEPRFARPDDPELETISAQRWWSRAQIAASGEVFAPRRLAVLLEPLLAGVVPVTTVDVGI